MNSLERNDNIWDIKLFQRLGARFETVKHLSIQLFDVINSTICSRSDLQFDL